MDVIHINSYYPSSSLYKNFENALMEKDVQITTFVAVNKSNMIDGNKSDLSHIHIKGLFNNFDRFLFYRKQHKIYKYFRENFQMKRSTILHAHSLFTNGYIAYRNYLENNTPYIVAVRNTDLNLFFSKMIHLRRLGVRILKHAKKIIFISEPYKNTVLNKYVSEKIRDTIEKKSKVIPNGIDSYWFENKHKPRKLNSSEIRLLFIGRINDSKNILNLIKATDILIEQGYDIKLDVVGEKVSLDIFNEIENNDYLFYKGILNKQELLKLYRQNDIFVLPSKRETFGLVYPEAMSQGLPVIYTKNQGFDKQLPDGLVGYPVLSSNPEDIANKIVQVKKHYNIMSTNSIDYVDKFDWNLIAEEYKDIYLSTIY